MKSVCIRSYTGPCFPAFGLNTERYEVLLRIQSECGKIRTRTTPNTNTFYEVKAKQIKEIISFLHPHYPARIKEDILKKITKDKCVPFNDDI